MLSKNELFRRINRMLCPLFLSSGMLVVFISVTSIGKITAIPFILTVVFLLPVFFFGHKRKFVFIYSASAFSIFFIWLFLCGGKSFFSDIVRAVLLEIDGIGYSLPLLGAPSICILAFLFSIISLPLTKENISSLPVCILTAGFAVIIWFSGVYESLTGLALMMIPALLVIIRNKNDNMNMNLPAFIYVVSIVAIVMLLLPSVDFADTRFKQKTDRLRQNIYDRFFFTEPRDVFSLADYGYYPQSSQDNRQLGGPAVPDDTPVLQVSTESDTYLRGVILDFYDGRSWSNSTGGRRYLYNSVRWKKARNIIFDEGLTQNMYLRNAANKHRVNIRILAPLSSTLFVPQRSDELTTGGEIIVYFNNAGELFATRNLVPGDTYSVSAPLFNADDPGLDILINAAEDIRDPEYEKIVSMYTQLPEHLEKELYTVAIKASSGENGGLNKAKAIMNWLRRNLRYKLDIGRQPENIDFVSYFVLDTQEGYCTHFASAMTILCRMIGLPSRYVEGFLAEPDNKGHAVLSGKQAHAWTEVYFPSFGWLTFDATPKAAEGKKSDKSIEEKKNDLPQDPEREHKENDTDRDDTLNNDNEHKNNETPSVNETDETSGTENNKTSPVFLILIIILALLIIYCLYKYYISDPRRNEKNKNPRDRVKVWINDIYLILESDGIIVNAGETPLSFMHRLDKEARYDLPISELGDYITYYSYSDADVDSDVIRYFVRIHDNLKRELAFSGKLRYVLFRTGISKPVMYKGKSN